MTEKFKDRLMNIGAAIMLTILFTAVAGVVVGAAYVLIKSDGKPALRVVVECEHENH